MTRRKKIYEGKAKILYEGPEPGTLIQYFKDDTTAFDATGNPARGTWSAAAKASFPYLVTTNQFAVSNV